jgi:hypothetical protein
VLTSASGKASYKQPMRSMEGGTHAIHVLHTKTAAKSSSEGPSVLTRCSKIRCRSSAGNEANDMAEWPETRRLTALFIPGCSLSGGKSAVDYVHSRFPSGAQLVGAEFKSQNGTRAAQRGRKEANRGQHVQTTRHYPLCST